MTPSAQLLSSLNMLEILLQKKDSLPWFSKKYFQHMRFAGSQDRRIILNILYDFLRLQGLYQTIWERLSHTHTLLNQSTQQLAIGWICHKKSLLALPTYFDDSPYGFSALTNQQLHEANLFNQALLNLSKQQRQQIAATLPVSLGKDINIPSTLLESLNHPAPVDLTYRTPLQNVADLAARLKKEGLLTIPTPYSPYGLRLKQATWGLEKTALYKKGFFDIQDESSQIAISLIPLPPKGILLDFCAGHGGKTLSLAQRLTHETNTPHQKKKNTPWRIISSDISEQRLTFLQRRLKQHPHWPITIQAQSSLLKETAEVDVLLLDVPCSGSGTWRRHPEKKWQLSTQDISQYVQQQKDIAQMAIKFLKPGGILVYMTCSIFEAENEEVVSFLQKTHPLKPYPIPDIKLKKALPADCFIKPYQIRLDPIKTGTDGFFLALLQKEKA